jgi:hypothetical protein
LPEVSTSETAAGLPRQLFGRFFSQLFKPVDCAADLPVRRSYGPTDISRGSATRCLEQFDDPRANNVVVSGNGCSFSHLNFFLLCRGMTADVMEAGEAFISSLASLKFRYRCLGLRMAID